MKIEVVDEIMGTGKSYTTLRYIENLALNDKEERWIYCTEYLSEIEQRTQENAEASHLWHTPMKVSDGNKTDSLKAMLSEPDVQLIGITHALLLSASRDSFINYLIKHRGYKLFLDETLDLINVYNGVKFGDFFKALHRKELKVEDEKFGLITWLATDEKEITCGYDTSTDQIKKDSAKGTIHCAIAGGSANSSASLSIVEIESDILFKQFLRVIVATYQIEDTLFDAYLNIKNIERIVCKDVVCSRTTTKKYIADRITFIDKYDKKFPTQTNLSSNWYNSKGNNAATAEDFKTINKAIKNIGDKNGCKGNAHLLGFTVPADKLGKQRDAKKIQPVGYPHTVCYVEVGEDGVEVVTDVKDKSKSAYIPCNARASNEYAGKNVMVHAYNRYPMLPIENYLTFHKVRFSAERFATNEIVQWVWRSAIRNGEPIKLAILSLRMRDLFKKWLLN